jgi:hypothetical protein
MAVWTKEALAKISPEERHNLWRNCMRLGRDDIVELIESSGLPYGNPKGLTLDSPMGKAMAGIINSEDGSVCCSKGY